MITKEEVIKAAKLAKISFTEDKLLAMQCDLNSIVTMIDKSLGEVDCCGVEPLRNVLQFYQRMDEDVVREVNISNEIFSNIPNKDSLAREIHCFVVPKVVE